MFQFKKTDSGVKEPDNSNSIPNSFGQVRTLKKDLENFGKKDTEDDAVIPKHYLAQNVPSVPLKDDRSVRQKLHSKSNPPDAPNNPFQSVPTPPPFSRQENTSTFVKNSSSQSFFGNTSGYQESKIPGNAESLPTPKKGKGKLFSFIVVIIIILAGGGGFYYYWFFIKGVPSSTETETNAKTATPISSSSNESAPNASTANQNSNLRSLIIDTTQGQNEIKNSIQKFANEFADSAAENDLVEAKIFNNDKQTINKKDFLSGLGLTVPDSVMAKFSDEYSIFVKKEQGFARLGLVFRTITSSGLSEEMKSWEPTMVSNLHSLYLSPVTSDTSGPFDSSRYMNADIRYFNFPSPANTSLDYSIISNFLVIGTSKSTERAILDYMSEK